MLASTIVNYNLKNRIKNVQVKLSVLNEYGSPIYKRYDSDSIVTLKDIVLDSLAEKLGVNPYQAQYGYPALFILIKFLRNKQYHDKANYPEDYRTGAKSFGNIYTMSCQLILTFYAFMEILESWASLK